MHGDDRASESKEEQIHSWAWTLHSTSAALISSDKAELCPAVLQEVQRTFTEWLLQWALCRGVHGTQSWRLSGETKALLMLLCDIIQTCDQGLCSPANVLVMPC